MLRTIRSRLYWLVLALAATGSIAINAQPMTLTAQIDALENGAKRINALIAANPTDPKIATLQTLSSTSVNILVNRLDTQWKALKSDTQMDANQKALKTVEIQSQIARIYKIASSANVPLTYMHVLNAQPTQVELSYQSNAAGVDPGSIDGIRTMVNGMKKKNAVVDLGLQTAYFEVAQGIFSLAMVGILYKDNPNAWETYMQSLKSPEGFLSLGTFIGTQHWVGQMAQDIRLGRVGRVMIPFMSMGAATLVSTIAPELVADKDFWTCTLSMVTLRTDVPTCDRLQKKWVVGHKIMQYAPQFTEMFAAMAMSSATSFALGSVFTGATEAAETAGKRFKLILTGARIMRGAIVGATESTDFTPVGAGIAVGELLIFFTWDHVLQEPVNDWFDEFRMTQFDLLAWWDRSGGHYEFDHRKDYSQQPIADAFEVMETNLATADVYLNKLVTTFQMDYSKLQRPASVCEPASKKLQLPSLFQSDYLQPQWWDNLAKIVPSPWTIDVIRRDVLRNWVNNVVKKDDAQLECEVLAQPLKLLDRYHEIHKQWRGILLGHFTHHMDAWQQTISNYRDVLDVSDKLKAYLGEIKFRQAHDFRFQMPKLDHDSIAQALQLAPPPAATSADPNADPNAAATPPKSHPDNLDQIATKDTLDFAIASFACGYKARAPGVLDNAWSFTKQVLGAMSPALGVLTRDTGTKQYYIETPFGSSAQFNPPNLTTGDGTVCTAGARLQDFHSSRRWNYIDPSHDAVMDEHNTKYDSLYAYVFANLDPKIWEDPNVLNGTGKPSGTNINAWWDDNVRQKIEPVWGVYSSAYHDLTNSEMRPPMFDHSFRTSCDARNTPDPLAADYNPDKTAGDDGLLELTENTDSVDEMEKYYPLGKFGIVSTVRTAQRQVSLMHGEKQCYADPSNTYLVPGGVVQSLEFETHQYLRALGQFLSPMMDKNFAGTEGHVAVSKRGKITHRKILGTAPFDYDTYLYDANQLLAEIRQLGRRIDGMNFQLFKDAQASLQQKFDTVKGDVLMAIRLDPSTNPQMALQILTAPAPDLSKVDPGQLMDAIYLQKATGANLKPSGGLDKTQIRQLLALNTILDLQQIVAEVETYSNAIALVEFEQMGAASGSALPKSVGAGDSFGTLHSN